MDTKLFQKIQLWSLDDPKTDEEFLFENQLAANNQWNSQFACLVSREYKRFVYLCLICNFSCVPSKAVDEAWHLHILRTANYSQMCDQLLGDYMHHQPTTNKESLAKLQLEFQQTLKAYREIFGENAPSAVWNRIGNAKCCDKKCQHNCFPSSCKQHCQYKCKTCNRKLDEKEFVQQKQQIVGT